MTGVKIEVPFDALTDAKVLRCLVRLMRAVHPEFRTMTEGELMLHFRELPETLRQALLSRQGTPRGAARPSLGRLSRRRRRHPRPTRCAPHLRRAGRDPLR